MRDLLVDIGCAVIGGAIAFGLNPTGTQTYFDKPEVGQALQFWMDLSQKHKIHPPGVVEWGTTPKDFFERKAAMIWTTTGNLTSIRSNAKFDFGVAMLPAGKQRGTPTGGGNFHVFKKATPAEREASLKFIQWITSPTRAAEWAIATGYVAVSPAAWETAEMKKYLADFPAPTVARDQLQYAVAELSTHENQRVTKALNDGLQAALTAPSRRSRRCRTRSARPSASCGPTVDCLTRCKAAATPSSAGCCCRRRC